MNGIFIIVLFLSENSYGYVSVARIRYNSVDEVFLTIMNIVDDIIIILLNNEDVYVSTSMVSYNA